MPADLSRLEALLDGYRDAVCSQERWPHDREPEEETARQALLATIAEIVEENDRLWACFRDIRRDITEMQEVVSVLEKEAKHG